MSDPISDAISGSMADAGMIEEAPAVETATPTEAAAPETPVATPAAEATPATEAQAAPAKTDEEVLGDIEKELTEKNPSLRNGQMTMSRHQAVLTRRTRDHEAAVAKVKEEHAAEVAKYNNDTVRDRLTAMELAEKNPDAFFHNVLLNDQRYKGLVDKMVEKAIGEKFAARPAAAAPQAAAPSARPNPDVLLPDGSLGYSAETMQKVLAHELAEYDKKIDGRLEERFKALDPVLKPVREVQEHQERLAQSTERMSTLLTEARETWPAFKENSDAILGKLKENNTWGLRRAYDAVVYGKFQTDLEAAKKSDAVREAQIRAAVMKEMSEGAPSAGLRARTPAAAVSSEGMNRDDALRSVVANAAAGLSR